MWWSLRPVLNNPKSKLNQWLWISRIYLYLPVYDSKPVTNTASSKYCIELAMVMSVCKSLIPEYISLFQCDIGVQITVIPGYVSLYEGSPHLPAKTQKYMNELKTVHIIISQILEILHVYKHNCWAQCLDQYVKLMSSSKVWFTIIIYSYGSLFVL